MADITLETSTPMQRYAAGYLTKAEAEALTKAGEQVRRDELGIPTYNRDVLTQGQSSIGYSVDEAAQNALRTESMMGTPGTAMYNYMSKEIAAGVPASIALNAWSSGNSAQGTKQSAYFGNINALQSAGYSPLKAYELVETVQVEAPTETQLAQTQAKVDLAHALATDEEGNVNPYFKDSAAWSTSAEDKSASARQDTKYVNALIEGLKSGSQSSAAAAWQERYGSQGWGQTGGGKTTTATVSSSPPSTMSSATEIYENVSKVGTVDPLVKAKADAIYSKQIEDYIQSSGLLKTSLEQVQQQQNPTKKTSTGTGDVLNLFGGKHERRDPRKKPQTSPKQYGSYGGSGFSGMIKELNRQVKSKLVSKPASSIKKSKPSTETWADLFLTDKKISNTKRAAIKPMVVKFPAIKTTKVMKVNKPVKKEYGSAWEQILFSKPKSGTKKATKSKRA